MHTFSALRALAFLFLAIVTLVLTATPSFAQEPPASVTTSLVTPSTYFVVVGANSGDYKNAPGLTGAEGGGNDCIALTSHLRSQGFDNEHLVSFCGSELVRARLFTILHNFMIQVRAGSTVFVVWMGHGGTDPITHEMVFATVDGSFDLFPGTDVSVQNTGYSTEGISADLLYMATQRLLPTDVRMVFVTDAARGGTYQTKGGTITLEGPSAENFRDMPGVYALSPTPGRAVPAGLTRSTLTQCLTAPTWGVRNLAARALLNCYTEGMTKGGVTIETAGSWGDEPLAFFPSPTVLIAPPPPLRASAGKVVLISGGGLVAATGSVGSIVTFVQASNLGEDISRGTYGTAGDPTLDAAVAEYNARTRTLPIWYAVTGVGIATTLVGIVIPTPHAAHLQVTALPNGMVVSGSF